MSFNLISKPYEKRITKIKLLPNEANAVALAVADISSMQEYDRPFQRYVWIPDHDDDKIGAICYAVNLACSNSSMIVYPSKIGGGALLRWDLRRLCPNDEDLIRLLKIWENFQFDPYFHVIVDSDRAIPTNTLQIEPNFEESGSVLQITELPSQPTDPTGSSRFVIDGQNWYRSPSGNHMIWVDGKWIKSDPPKPAIIPKLNLPEDIEQVSAYGAHCGLEQAVILQSLTQSNSSITRYDFFLTKILSVIDGGLYYDLVGIEDGSTQADLLERLGANITEIEELRSDQKAAIFRSNVTGKPRAILAFQGSGIRPGVGTGLITITQDVGDGSIDPRVDPIKNLLDADDDAREFIAERPNGLHLFALFDGDGNIQDEAPPDVVKDHTIPAPHTARLQPAISCIRCHGPDEGLKPFQNDAQTMLKSMLDVFDDLSSKQSIPETLDRLAGLYSGNLDKPIRRAKDDYDEAVFRATRGMSVIKTSAVVSDIYGKYNYDLVTPQVACKELGFEIPSDKAVFYLNQLLPPLQRDEIGVSPEDPYLGALKAGIGINRYQWEQVFADAAFRVLQTRKQLAE